MSVVQKKLLIFFLPLFFLGCKKDRFSPLQYTARITGTYHWSGTVVYEFFHLPDSTVSVNYVFSLVAINDTTVKVGFDSSLLHYSNSNDSELFFSSSSYWNKYFFDTIVSRSLRFNYRSNQFSYFRGIGLDLAYGETLIIHTP